MLTRRSVVAGALATVAAPAILRAASFLEVDVALVLAADSSRSVNAHRFNLQKEGYVHALRNPKVIQAIRSGATGKIAVTFFYWSTAHRQQLVVPWSVISDARSAYTFAAAIQRPDRRLFGGTSISGALFYAEWRLHPVQLDGIVPLRKVVDVSGDGPSNAGDPSYKARDALVAQNITINGLPILGEHPDVFEHYRDEVIGGPGNFMKPAASFEHFGETILSKLLLEIA